MALQWAIVLGPAGGVNLQPGRSYFLSLPFQVFINGLADNGRNGGHRFLTERLQFLELVIPEESSCTLHVTQVSTQPYVGAMVRWSPPGWLPAGGKQAQALVDGAEVRCDEVGIPARHLQGTVSKHLLEMEHAPTTA